MQVSSSSAPGLVSTTWFSTLISGEYSTWTTTSFSTGCSPFPPLSPLQTYFPAWCRVTRSSWRTAAAWSSVTRLESWVEPCLLTFLQARVGWGLPATALQARLAVWPALTTSLGPGSMERRGGTETFVYLDNTPDSPDSLLTQYSYVDRGQRGYQ